MKHLLDPSFFMLDLGHVKLITCIIRNSYILLGSSNKKRSLMTRGQNRLNFHPKLDPIA